MKKNIKATSILLLAVPFLMANAPVPQCDPQKYYDFEATYVGYEQEEEKYNNTIHVKNTGKGYISSESFWVGTKKGECNIASGVAKLESSLFTTQVLIPNQEFDVTFKTNETISEPEKLVYTAHAYWDIDENATYSGSLAVTKANNYGSKSDFYYELDATIDEKDSNYDYGAILEIVYQEKTYYIAIKRNFIIQSNEELDISQLSSVAVKAIVRDKAYNLFGCNSSVDLTSLLLGNLVILGVFGTLVFLPIVIAKATKSRRTKKA